MGFEENYKGILTHILKYGVVLVMSHRDRQLSAFVPRRALGSFTSLNRLEIYRHHFTSTIVAIWKEQYAPVFYNALLVKPKR